ncbi:MAG: transposase [Scytonema sp. PMC 1069.18]|nr:transposase [Scytonema sp. PMC 1069.18]
MNRGDLSTEQWERLKTLLPPQKPRTGKPNQYHRQVVNGILWILRTGAPWPDMPERYGKWESIATMMISSGKHQLKRIVFPCVAVQIISFSKSSDNLLPKGTAVPLVDEASQKLKEGNSQDN